MTMDMFPDSRAGGAVMSSCGNYRFALTRTVKDLTLCQSYLAAEDAFCHHEREHRYEDPPCDAQTGDRPRDQSDPRDPNDPIGEAALLRQRIDALTRSRSTRRLCVFCMLNPSMADALRDDATIRRCMRFALDWECTNLRVVNLYAYRTVSPVVLFAQQRAGVDIVGEDNDHYITNAVQRARYWLAPRWPNGLVVCAWGGNAEPERALAVRKLIGTAAHYLRLNDDGTPSHPLRLPASLEPVPWTMDAAA